MKVNRRSFLYGFASSILESNGGSQTIEPGLRSACFVREYNNSQLLAISPNGEYLCLNHGNMVSRFRDTAGGLVRLGEGAEPKISIVALPELREVWGKQLQGIASGASFFAEGRRVYVEASIQGQSQSSRFTYDLESKTVNEVVIDAPPKTVVSCFAYSSDILIASERHYPPTGNVQRYWKLIRASTGEELRRDPYGPNGSPEDAISMSMPCISSNRSRLVHSFGSSIVSRNPSNLKVEWSISLDSKYRAWRLGISANGQFVTAAMMEDGGINGPSRKKFIAVLDGLSGKLVTRIELDGINSVAITSDGKTLAAAAELEGTPRVGQIQTVVRVCDVDSRSVLETIVHAESSNSRRLESGLLPNGLHFTPDNKYLICSGSVTRICKFGKCT